MHQFLEATETYRDLMWRRESANRIESPGAAENFIESVGFCAALTDCRRPGPSLYIAVCGRRDAYMPRNVQKDPESSLAWTLKDQLIRRGRVYYSKLVKGHSTFIAPRLIPHFAQLWGVPRKAESRLLSTNAQKILRVLRSEWEMASGDLRKASGINERAHFNKALDELQKNFKVIATDVIYEPVFTYIWSIVEGRFREELAAGVTREQALTEIARAYLTGAGVTMRGELSRVTGLSRPDAGVGSWALVDEDYAVRVAPGVYLLKQLLTADPSLQ